jgi:hypothetical protein
MPTRPLPKTIPWAPGGRAMECLTATSGKNSMIVSRAILPRFAAEKRSKCRRSMLGEHASDTTDQRVVLNATVLMASRSVRYR